jgi:hypothetical protein
VYNLNYAPTAFRGYKVGEKLRLWLSEQKNLYTTGPGTVGASTAHKPMGLHGLLQEQRYVYRTLHRRVSYSRREDVVFRLEEMLREVDMFEVGQRCETASKKLRPTEDNGIKI